MPSLQHLLPHQHNDHVTVFYLNFELYFKDCLCLRAADVQVGHQYLSYELLGSRVPRLQEVVQWPLDHVIHVVQLSCLLIPVFKQVQSPQQQMHCCAQGQTELDMIARCDSDSDSDGDGDNDSDGDSDDGDDSDSDSDDDGDGDSSPLTLKDDIVAMVVKYPRELMTDIYTLLPCYNQCAIGIKIFVFVCVPECLQT